MIYPLLGLLIGSTLLSSVGHVFSRNTMATTQAGVSIFPANDSMNLHPSGPISVDFNGPVPAPTSFSLVDGEGVPIQFQTMLGAEGESVYIKPQVPMKFNEQHKFCVDAPQKGLLGLVRAIRRKCVDFKTMQKPDVRNTLDAPVLVVQGNDRVFSRYYSAILEAEGINSYATISIEDLSSPDISNRSVVIWDSAGLPTASREVLVGWVQKGGLLVLMRPSAELRRTFGLSETSDGVFQVASMTPDADSPITSAFPRVPLHVQGPVDRVPEASDSSSEETTLLRVESEKQNAQAVEMKQVGQGHIVSFAFDLSRSIVLTRQGNPIWIDEDRDESEPVRPNDLFSSDFLQSDSAVVPSADELQRLLVNIIAEKSSIPVPRFWYLPDKRRAVLVMTADDHGTDGGTLSHFNRMDALSPPDCDVDGWECLRASSYLSPGTDFAHEAAKAFTDKGFEVGVHVDTGCKVPPSRTMLAGQVRDQIEDFRVDYPDIPKQTTHRIHCIIWKGWLDVAEAQRDMGIRLDLNYYHWSPDWLKGRQIFMTGSGFPMPYARRDGSILDVYQSATHLVNENGVPHDEGIIYKLDRALGAEQYFGAFVTHYDFSDGYAQRLIKLGRERNVAMITARQLLTWLDARNASRFHDLNWDGTTLSFQIVLHDDAKNAFAALPSRFQGKRISRVTCGEILKVTTEVIKGLSWTFFPATSGPCTATYEQTQVHRH